MTEIIQNHNATLEGSKSRYDQYFRILKSRLVEIGFNEKVVLTDAQLRTLPKNHVNYLLVTDLIREIAKLSSNPFLYLENVLILFEDSDFAVDKESSKEITRLLTHQYHSASYPYVYWSDLLQKPAMGRLYPDANFSFGQIPGKTSHLMPYAIRGVSSNYSIIALIDTKKLNEAYQPNV